MKEFFEDDRIIIPEDIKAMSKEQIKAEITRLEAEAAKDRHIQEHNKQVRL